MVSRLAMKDWLGRLASRTPTLALSDDQTGCTFWLKLEYLLPSGSTKDRVAAFILLKGIEAGLITERTLVVEASSGSTAIAFAMACAFIGVRFRAVMPEGVTPERLLMIRRYGGETVLTSPERGIAGAIEEARQMAAGDRLVFWPQQFDNPLSAATHQRFTGPELIADVGRPIDGFVAGVGTGGTLMGIGRALREAGQTTAIVRACPEKGICLAGEPEVCGGIPGVVDGLSTILDMASISTSEDILVPDPDAIAAARLLGERGLPVGPSSGLNFAACVRLAGRLGAGHHIATVLCDRMERYFSGALFDDVRDQP
jgi:cysteine synthase